jgi:hypothetical protein
MFLKAAILGISPISILVWYDVYVHLAGKGSLCAGEYAEAAGLLSSRE